MQMKLLDKSQDRRYFTIIPNLLWVSDLGLRPTDFKLYATIKKVAGESGECFMSTRTLAAEAGISMGAVSASKGRLEGAGLITIVAKRRRNGGQPVDHISIVDIWQQNMEHFVSCDKRSPGEHSDESVHQVNTLAVERSPGEHKRSPGETEEEHIEEEPIEEELLQPELDVNFGTALKAYQDTFGPLGSSHLYDKFQMLWDEHPNLKTHQYARKEMYRAMMDDSRRVRPNLAYYAQCLATGAARVEGKREERRNGKKRRNVPKRTVADINDPAIQEWLAERSANGDSD